MTLKRHRVDRLLRDVHWPAIIEHTDRYGGVQGLTELKRTARWAIRDAARNYNPSTEFGFARFAGWLAIIHGNTIQLSYEVFSTADDFDYKP